MGNISLKQYKKKYKKTWKISKEQETCILSDKEYKERLFLEDDCTELIWLNLQNDSNEKFSLKKVKQIIRLQGEYIIKEQKKNKNLIVWDPKNIKWLVAKTKMQAWNLDKVLNLENVYLKVIGCLEN